MNLPFKVSAGIRSIEGIQNLVPTGKKWFTLSQKSETIISYSSEKVLRTK